MTQYFCPKCNKITLESKDFYVFHNRQCRYCSEILKPFESDFLKRLNNIETKERIKFKGELWEIHKFDKDSFPSNPHAHNLITGEKLNLENGEIFNPKINKITRQIKIKDLDSFKSQSKLLQTFP